MNPNLPPHRGSAASAALTQALLFAFALTLTISPAPAIAADAPDAPAQTASDPQALDLARRTLQAMGGRDAWEQTRFLRWTFFNGRRHLWDKHTGRARVEWHSPEGPVFVLMNLNTKEGQAYIAGREIVDAEPLRQLLDQAYAAWVNDSYWLLMPYKLLDPGVVLKYRGEAALPDGRPADLIEMTFQAVGLTPRNKYHVLIARDTSLVEQWAYFPDAADQQPRLTTPWAGWHRFGRILLSGDRGQWRQITDLAVYDQMPETAFTDPAPVAWPEPAPNPDEEVEVEP